MSRRFMRRIAAVSLLAVAATAAVAIPAQADDSWGTRSSNCGYYNALWATYEGNLTVTQKYANDTRVFVGYPHYALSGEAEIGVHTTYTVYTSAVARDIIGPLGNRQAEGFIDDNNTYVYCTDF
jgi:hypothetical protein